MKKIIIILSILFYIDVNASTSSMTKYYKTTMNNGKYLTKEISAYDYINVPAYELQNSEVNTEYKKMVISKYNNTVKLFVSWKKTPNFLSYDIISIMSDNIIFNNNTIIGNQKNNINIINYNFSSQNTKIFANGFGISMNLVDNAIEHTLTLQANIDSNSGTGRIYGNYRHARNNISLTNSLNYYLMNGNIIFYNSTIDGYYDKINPVWIDV